MQGRQLARAALFVTAVNCRAPRTGPRRSALDASTPVRAVPLDAAPRSTAPVLHDASIVTDAMARSGRAPSRSAIVTALHRVVRVTDGPRPLGDGRFWVVTQEIDDDWHVLDLSLVSEWNGAARIEATTDLAEGWRGDEPDQAPRVLSIDVSDFDRDGEPEIAVTTTHESRPIGTIGYRSYVTFAVFDVVPTLASAYSVDQDVVPQDDYDEVRQSTHAWSDANHDGHPDIVVSSTVCPNRVAAGLDEDPLRDDSAADVPDRCRHETITALWTAARDAWVELR